MMPSLIAPPIFTVEDPERAALVLAALLDLLADDPRVQRAADGWAARVEARVTAAQARDPVAAMRPGLALAAALSVDLESERDRLRALLETLHLSAYPWLADVLVFVLRAALLGYGIALSEAATGETRMVGESVRAIAHRDAAVLRARWRPSPSAQKGRRRIRSGGDEWSTFVSWLYRRDVQRPGETHSAIARAYATERFHPDTGTRGESVISKAIDRVYSVLDDLRPQADLSGPQPHRGLLVLQLVEPAH